MIVDFVKNSEMDEADEIIEEVEELNCIEDHYGEKCIDFELSDDCRISIIKLGVDDLSYCNIDGYEIYTPKNKMKIRKP